MIGIPKKKKKNWLSLVHVIFVLELEIEALRIGRLARVIISVLMRWAKTSLEARVYIRRAVPIAPPL